jgi:hypothetical protein
MRQTLNSRPARAVRIHCPATAATIAAMRDGQADAIETDPAVAPLLAIIRADNPLGDFGLYKGVVEIALGHESFIPTGDANPTSGAAGTISLLPSVVLTTYIADDAPEPLVTAALDALVAAHPWETPVIEVWSTSLLTRQG